MKNLSSIIFILLAVALFFLYIKPEWNTVSALRMQKATYDSGLEQAQQVQKLRDTLVSQYNSISPADQKKLDLMLPETFSAAKIASDINVRASSHGMAFKGISAAADDTVQASAARNIAAVSPAATEPYQTHAVSFTVVGSYRNFIAFLKDLESNVQLLDVTKVDIAAESQGATGGPSGLSFKVSAKTYSLK